MQTTCIFQISCYNNGRNTEHPAPSNRPFWAIQATRKKEGISHMVNMKKIALFAAGTLFGSAGFKLLSSSDAKKVYTQTAAAVLRMKDSTMETVNKVQEQAGDILADAKAINEARAAKAEAPVIEDAAEETASTEAAE